MNQTIIIKWKNVKDFPFSDAPKWYYVVFYFAYIADVYWDGSWFYYDAERLSTFDNAHEIEYFAEKQGIEKPELPKNYNMEHYFPNVFKNINP